MYSILMKKWAEGLVDLPGEPGNSINFNLLDGSVSMMCNLNGEVLCRAEFMREVRCTAPDKNN